MKIEFKVELERNDNWRGNGRMQRQGGLKEGQRKENKGMAMCVCALDASMPRVGAKSMHMQIEFLHHIRNR